MNPVKPATQTAQPEAAAVPDPPVLEAPCRDARFRQGCARVTRMGQVVLGQPAATVDVHDDRMRSRAAWYSELTELARVGPVGDALVG